LENLKERNHLEDLGVDGKIILEGILGKQGVKVWTGFIWDQWRAVVKMVTELRVALRWEISLLSK
jgi:hypothetical protein